MADAAAAFGLAAGILQFLDFGTRFAKKALRIYQAGKRGTDELLQLQSTIEDLQCVANSLGPTKNAGQVSLDDEASIWKLAEDCQQVATEVLSSLKKIRRPAASGKLDAVRTAFQITWNQDEIGSFRVRLSEFREQLNLHLLVSLRQYARESAEQQEEVLKRLGVPNSDAGNTGQSAHRDGGIGSPVLRFVTAKLPPRSQAAATEDLKSRIIAEIYKITELNIQGDSAPPRELGHGREIAEKTFLSSLYYSAMEDREEKIAAAHSKTFQWVFEGSRNGSAQHWSCLKTWLESNEQLYWITGKAGSGKSTLMKFICSPAERGSMETPQGTKARCEKHLRRWAGDNRLIIASFYFWNSGVRTQMSLNGLFRTLLFQILRQCPEMIPAISPGRWEALLLFNTDDREWSNSELLRLLRLVTRKSPENDKFCLFVDGLDEFGGDHGDLISLLQDLLLNGNVKVCVASRPWLVFEDAFNHRPSLRLEDLTYDDIKAYVASHFNDSPGFVQLQIREPVYSSRLIENVVEKASGVFIWVYLVVSSLLTG